MTVEAVPLRYHGPGWKVVMPDGEDAILWAPRVGVPGTHDRPNWCAAWSNVDGSYGSFAEGASAAEAIDAALAGCPFAATVREPLYARAVRHAAHEAVTT